MKVQRYAAVCTARHTPFIVETESVNRLITQRLVELRRVCDIEHLPVLEVAYKAVTAAVFGDGDIVGDTLVVFDGASEITHTGTLRSCPMLYSS